MRGAHRIARRVAPGRVRQREHAEAIDHLERGATGGWIDAAQRDGHHLGPRRGHRPLHRLQRAKAAAADDQSGAPGTSAEREPGAPGAAARPERSPAAGEEVSVGRIAIRPGPHEPPPPSDRSSASSSAHSIRRTTSPSTATATPRLSTAHADLLDCVGDRRPIRQLRPAARSARRSSRALLERRCGGEPGGAQAGESSRMGRACRLRGRLGGQLRRDRLRRERRHQDAVAVVAGGQQQPLQLPGPIRGALSGVPGRRPANASTSSSSAISGSAR